MERSIALCNGISQWVQLMVLSRPTPQLRAEVFIKFIHVAQVSGWTEIPGHGVNDFFLSPGAQPVRVVSPVTHSEAWAPSLVSWSRQAALLLSHPRAKWKAMGTMSRSRLSSAMLFQETHEHLITSHMASRWAEPAQPELS